MARIQSSDGVPVTSVIGKLEIIRHHILASIQMQAIAANPYTTHVVVMACEEMVRSVATKRGVPLDSDYRTYIKDEFQEQYLRIVRRPYNWFKHADRDGDEIYDGPSASDLARANEFQTLFNIRGFTQLGDSVPTIFTEYIVLLSAKYPSYFRMEFLDRFPSLKGMYERLDRDPETLRLALQMTLRAKGLLPPDLSGGLQT